METTIAPTNSPATNSIELTTAELTLALSKEGLAYQELLQQCEDVVFTNDNLNEKRDCLINLRKVKSKLAATENPFTERWKNWNSSKKSLADPVDELLARKEAEFKKKAEENAAAAKKIADEKAEDDRIKLEIDNFFLAQSQAVAAAKTPEELVRVEKLIGSHKAAPRYGKHLPLMAEKAQNLTELIRSAKDAIKKIADLREKESLAEKSGDDQAVLDLREQQEQVTASLHESRERVQETAIHMATQSGVTEVETVVAEAPKPRRSTWTWEVKDIKSTVKKMPDWVRLEANVDKIDDYLKAKKIEGIEGESFDFAGIHFYLSKTY